MYKFPRYLCVFLLFTFTQNTVNMNMNTHYLSNFKVNKKH